MNSRKFKALLRDRVSRVLPPKRLIAAHGLHHLED